MKKVSIMQPYFFPYVGYYQLVAQADTFVFLDDVNFINKGWINRNRILINGAPSFITVPLIGASQNRLIHEIEISYQEKWREKLLKSLEMNYKKTPFFLDFYPYLQTLFVKDNQYISELCVDSIRLVFDYLEIKKQFAFSSLQDPDKTASGEQRIIHLAKLNQAQHYVNPEGGTDLYHPDNFSQAGIKLQFLKTELLTYSQYNCSDFVPYLSIIDLVMNMSKSDLKTYLEKGYSYF